MKEELRKRIIENGIKNLNEFGYTQVDKDNILTDDVYSQFFLSMLNDNLGNNKVVDEVINGLIKEIKNM